MNTYRFLCSYRNLPSIDIFYLIWQYLCVCIVEYTYIPNAYFFILPILLIHKIKIVVQKLFLGHSLIFWLDQNAWKLSPIIFKNVIKLSYSIFEKFCKSILTSVCMYSRNRMEKIVAEKYMYTSNE